MAEVNYTIKRFETYGEITYTGNAKDITTVTVDLATIDAIEEQDLFIHTALKFMKRDFMVKRKDGAKFGKMLQRFILDGYDIMKPTKNRMMVIFQDGDDYNMKKENLKYDKISALTTKLSNKYKPL